MAEKKYIIDNPDLMAEWDWEKNNGLGLEPKKLSYGLNTKAWWICSKCGNRWQARITTRASRHSGCPYCAPNQSKVSEHNSLLACFPDLAREWNYDKNGVLTPDKIRFGSKKKVWWKCALGHEWQAVVSSRTNPSSGRGCPICYREYKTSFPEQAVFYYVKHFFDDAISGYISDGFEIDIFIPSLSFGVEYDGMAYHTGKKNGDKEERKNTYCKSKGIKLVRLKETIDNLLADSDGIIWCHYTPNNTFLNSAIKTLMSQYLLIANPEVDVTRDSIAIQEQYVCSVKEKSIATLHPDIAKEWHPSKNGSLKPEFVRAASNKKYWWLCPNGHEYDMTALNRHNGFKCPYCSGRRILAGYNDLQTRYPQIAEQWDYEKNEGVTPQEVTSGTTRRFWWRCKKGHSWYTSITTRVEGGGCPYCSPYQSAVCEDNCLASVNPELSKQWDVVKNGNLTPYDVRPNSERKVWWLCDKGHSWETSIKTRNKGNSCPYCSNQRVLKGYNDLATTDPDLLIDWNYEKNESVPPDSIAHGSNKMVWWKCHVCGFEWQTRVYVRYQGRGKCPTCKSIK